VEVLVLEGPRELKDQKIRIRPDVVTSCVTIGRKKGYLAIANKLASQSKQIFVALVFERSWLDHIIGMVGADPYYFPGDRSVGF
ncbi:hypothetical protein, partial [Parasphingorhabdus sp.]|uniref:hypothetical protein n=1 Tax=Parasphingorhabdus sp. TaxID=2709688 RepID=UPI0030022175